MSERRLQAIDLCCGAGGWACAARGLPIDIIMAVDWWEPACLTYRLNHPATQVIRADIKHPPFNPVTLRGKIDLVVGGIPCEWLSNYRGWSDQSRVKPEEIATERALLDSVLAIVLAIAPRYWCLEDVKGIVRELPPMTPYTEIDAAKYSGQRRKRVYVGEFPHPSPPPADARHKTLGHYIRPGPYRVGRRLSGREPATARTFSQSTFLAAYPGKKAPTVCNYGSRRDSELGLMDDRVPGGVRQLEWQEGSALQGYPGDYVFWGSPTDVSVMVARSIQIDTGRAILEGICRDFATRTDEEVAA